MKNVYGLLYDELTPKQRRTLGRAIAVLFTPRAYLRQPTVDALRAWPLRPFFTVNSKTLFLSDRGVEMVNVLIDLLAATKRVAAHVTQAELSAIVFKEFASWLGKDLKPGGREYIESLDKALQQLVAEYYFLVKVEGLELKDIDSVELGCVRLVRPHAAILKDVKFGKYLKRAWVYKQLDGKLWLIGEAAGSPRLAEERFEHSVLLANGMLAIYAAILYKGAIWRSRIRAVINPSNFETRWYRCAGERLIKSLN